MPLPFNKALDLKLMEHVRENAILYNTKHSKYLDFDAREVVWQKIGDALSRPAAEFAGIQCQIHFEDFQEEKHKPGFIENLNEYLPETYASSWGIEKKVLKAYRKQQGLSSLEAKNLYIKTARDLPTYGVTFFLVKEKQKDKKKLVPRLLGINSEAILRLDENTKEILQQWPLTHVKTYHVGKSETFTLNFGDYSDKEYSAKTQDAHRIRDILEGYIDIIRRRALAPPAASCAHSMPVYQDNVSAGQSHIIQHVAHQPSKLLKETFVGPSRILPYDQGSTAQAGTQVMTMQQLIQSTQFNNPQQAISGEPASPATLAGDCFNKLKRMNSNSVKIVTLLTEPTEGNLKDTQKIVGTMKEDLVVVEMGVKATVQQQSIEESRKMLLEEMQDLASHVSKLCGATGEGHVDAGEAKAAAENIAHLTSEMCLAHDPRSRRRSELLNRSKKSMILGEKLDENIRRASFLQAAGTAAEQLQGAQMTLDTECTHKLDESQCRYITSQLQDRMGKLNAALALYLTAHSDPNNVDYAAAIDSMNDINSLTPLIAADAVKLSGTKDAAGRDELLQDMSSLFDGARRLCLLTAPEDHDKVQEALNSYADVANKLIYTFSRGNNVGKENEIIELAKEAGAKTSTLLLSVNSLSPHSGEAGAAQLDAAGVRAAGAARDLLACAQLTAPAIREPHCQSALSAAAERLACHLRQLAGAARDDTLQLQETDVQKAIERLKDAYANLADGADDESLPLEERRRLKFVRSLAGVRNNLQDLQCVWGKPCSGENEPGRSVVQELKRKEATPRLAQQLAQLNASCAALALATHDGENPDYVTAELALNTMAELLPQIVNDTDVVSSGQDEATRHAMRQHVTALCDAAREMMANLEPMDGLGQSAAKFSAASSKLVFLISPGADKGKEKKVSELSAAAYDSTAELLSHVYRVKSQCGGDVTSQLDRAGARAEAAARALVSVGQLTAPSLHDPRCSSALVSAVEQLRGCTDQLTATCQPHVTPVYSELEELQESRELLDKLLNRLLLMCPTEPTDTGDVLQPEQREKNRIYFIKSMSDASRRLEDLEAPLNQPVACAMMREEDAISRQQQLTRRLAQLNATVTALAVATTDRSHPDYPAAQKAVDSITELMPLVVQDACVLSSTKGGDTQRHMLEQVRALCEASRALCHDAGQAQGVSEAAAKLSVASGQLVYLVSPAADHDKEKQIIELCSVSCVRGSELLSHVQALTLALPPDAAQELDLRGAATADAAQALLTAAQLTAPTISSSDCSSALVSAAEHLRSSARELTSACSPHLATEQQELVQLQDSKNLLEKSLDDLVLACRDAQRGGDFGTFTGALPQEHRQRLQFVKSLSEVRSCLDDAQHLLKQPVQSAAGPRLDPATLQRNLKASLAQLNAAIAAFIAATADREKPDYVAAQQAVDTIRTLTPQLVQDGKTLCASKDVGAQQSLLEQLQALCDASRTVCGDDSRETQGIVETAAKFAEASRNLMLTVNPDAECEREKLVAAASMGHRGGELLAEVKELTKALPVDVANDVDRKGTATADAVEALLAVTQVTAGSMSSPQSQNALESAVRKLRGSADELVAACSPHVGEEAQNKLRDRHLQLLQSLDMLLQVCRETGGDAAAHEQQRVRFIRSVSAASGHLDDAEKQLNEPLVCPRQQPDSSALQRQLRRRLVQLNMSVAALTAATTDYKNPDYPAAERSIITITELMPKVVQESKALSCTQDESARRAVLQHLYELCGASRDICGSAGEPRKMNEAAMKFAESSSKLVSVVGPGQEEQDLVVTRTHSVKRKAPSVPQRASSKPAVPVRRSSSITLSAPRRSSCITQDFLDALRSEETQDNAARVVAAQAKSALLLKTSTEQCGRRQYCAGISGIREDLQRERDSLQLLYNAGQINTPEVDAVEVASREQDMEDSLAKAGVEVAALVSTNYADKLDYKAALEPTVALSKCVRSVLEDGRVVSSTLPDAARKSFLRELSVLCDVTGGLCDAALDHNRKLNEAAVSFGNQSAKLLRVVCADVNPSLEKEVISRAKAIGDSASRLALAAGDVAGDTTSSHTGDKQSRVQDICAAGAQCVDAAGKLVYTAKLVAPTIHHSICQDTLISSADILSTNLATFADSWKLLDSNSRTRKLTEEGENLERLLLKLKGDVKNGKLGKRKEVDQVLLDTPLRQLTVQIIDNAKNMSEHAAAPRVVQQQYAAHARRLRAALRRLDLARARCQRAAHDKNRRNEMEGAIQDLQMTLLQSHPARIGREQDHIVDFRDFLQAVVTESDHLAKSAEKQEAAIGKRVADDIQLACSHMSSQAATLLEPTHHAGDDSFDDVMEIHEFAQECELLLQQVHANICSASELGARGELRARLLPLAENCLLLRFATNSAISTARSAAFDVALQDLDDFDNNIITALRNHHKENRKEPVSPTPPSSVSEGAALSLLCATARAARGQPQAVRRALTAYSVTALDDTPPDYADEMLENLMATSREVRQLTQASSVNVANWQPPGVHARAAAVVRDIYKARSSFEGKPKLEILKEEDINKLLICQKRKVEGTRTELSHKFQQLSSQLSSTCANMLQSVLAPQSLGRSAHVAAGAAVELADTARGLKDHRKPVQSQRIEDACHEMCLATYSMLKTAELLSQSPNHPDTRRKLLEACRYLNDAIDKLNVASHPAPSLPRECAGPLRRLQLCRSALQAAPAPAAACPYAHCVDTLHSQRDVLQKLNNSQEMPRSDFLQSMLYVTSALGNCADCAAHAHYLLSVSDTNKEVAVEGLVDVGKMQRSLESIHHSCVGIIMDPGEQVLEDKKILENQVDELLKELHDAVERTRAPDTKKMLQRCRQDVEVSARALYSVIVERKPTEEIISVSLRLSDTARRVFGRVARACSPPPAGRGEGEGGELVQRALALICNAEELIKEVKLSPAQSELISWTSYNKRKDVLAAYDALLKTIKSKGQEMNILEADMDDSAQNKSYLQKQTDVALRWLHKPMVRTEVRTEGQEAVRRILDVGKKMLEDLSGADREDMRHLLEETEQLFTVCCKKYDQEQYGLLMERIRELRKAIERMAVTRVVEDFMDAGEPLADLDLLVDAERDEKARAFLLERKIAELLAQLARVGATARLVAGAGAGEQYAGELDTCRQQTELLAPMLVKAAEQRIHKPDDQAVIDNYKSLLARYTESLSKVRDLCDQSVDPMDFVQTAGETMQRMREHSSKENDPMKCAYTSAAITKLAGRVIHVGLSSRTARDDPELQQALGAAQAQLAAAAPAADTRASRLPDWRDTTAKILRATEEVESVLGGENIFKKQPDTNQPIYNEALNLHVAIRDWSSRDNEIVAVAKRMAVLMAKLSDYMNNDKQREVLTTSKAIVSESNEVARLAKKLAHECSDHRIKTNLLQVCERIPTISGQLKMLTTVKGSALGRHGSDEDQAALGMLVGNAQGLMSSIQDVVKAAASASVKIMSQRGPRIKWVRKTYY